MNQCNKTITVSIQVLFSIILFASHIVSAAETPIITINGASDKLADNILNHLNLPAESCEEDPDKLLSAIISASTEAANALGYYHPNITPSITSSTLPKDTQQEPAPEKSCWNLLITIEPGDAIEISTVNIELISTLAYPNIFDDAVKNSEIITGKQLNHGNYDSLKNNLTALAIENGYFSARYNKSEMRLDLIKNLAEIDIQFDLGERYQFGELNLQSDNSLSSEFIRRMLPFSSGDFYSSSDLIELKQNLDQSQYFNQVSINPQLTSSTNSLIIPIDVTLQPRPKHAYSSGIGFTTDTGPRVRLSYEDRYLNQNGHRLRGDAAFSPILSHVNFHYTVPLRNPVRESLNFSSGYLIENIDSLQSNLFKVELSYLNESENGWLRKVSASHLQDIYEIGLEKNKSELTIFSVSISKINADNLINPTSGWKLFLETKAALDSVLSDATFAQIYGSAKRIIKHGQRGRFISRLEIASTWIDNESDLPASLRFFAGGDKSIRGYKYQDLGPMDINNNVQGGKHLIVGSLEYDYLIKGNWRTTVFYDRGNAFSSTSNFEWEHSLGFGIHWISPIGPIRVDLAKGLGSSAGIRLHITMGPDL